MDFEDYFARADVFKREGDFYKYILYYTEGLERLIRYGEDIDQRIKKIYNEIKYVEDEDVRKALSNYLLGVKSEAKHAYRKALKYFENARKIAISLDDNFLLGWVLCEIGNCYRALKIYNKALDSYKEGMDYAKKAKDKETIGILHHHIALTLFELKTDIGKCFHHLKEAEKSFLDIDDIHYLFNTYSLFIAYYAAIDFDKNKASEYIEKAEELKEKVKNPYLLASFYDSKAVFYLRMGDYGKAEENISEALK
ncbi:MAG: tetratricopeptide repeat protein, partial [Candidatus Methanospirareceae archaeon]